MIRPDKLEQLSQAIDRKFGGSGDVAPVGVADQPVRGELHGIDRADQPRGLVEPNQGAERDFFERHGDIDAPKAHRGHRREHLRQALRRDVERQIERVPPERPQRGVVHGRRQ